MALAGVSMTDLPTFPRTAASVTLGAAMPRAAAAPMNSRRDVSLMTPPIRDFLHRMHK